MNVKLYRLIKFESRINDLYSDGKYQEALILGKKLLEGSKETEDYHEMLTAHINLAGCYFNLGQIEKAFEHVYQYKQLCDKYGDTRDQFYLYSLSALLYQFDKNYKKAEELIKECIHLSIELKMFHEASVCYNIYATFLNSEQQYEKAKQIANTAMRMAKKYSPGDVLLHCQIYLNIATAQIYLGNVTVAKNILFPLKNNAYLENHLHEKAQYHYTIGLLFIKLNHYHEALQHLQKSYQLFLKFNDLVMLKRVLKEIVFIYEQLSDLSNAYHYLKKFVKISEQLKTYRLSARIIELDVKNSVAVIERRANIDSLTEIYNRYYLETSCNKWLKEIKKTDGHLCCIMFDIDNFKHINDTFGHLVGDEVIKVIAQTTKQFFKNIEGIVGRYGGDEFIVFLKDLSTTHIMPIAQKLFQTISNTSIPYLKNNITVTISMGVVCTDCIPNAKRFTQVFRLADQALYLAKKQGKNQIVSLSQENCKNQNFL